MGKITVVDSIMGSGKTTFAINKMESDDDNNYIYITPYLTEIQRIKNTITNKKFYEPINIGNGKLDSLHKLILDGKNIASTHALFRTANEETMELIKANNYILILDEVMDVIEEIPLKKDDMKILLDQQMISVDGSDNNMVVWNEDKLDMETQYNYLKRMCLNKNVFMVNNVLLMWTFPIEVFKCFKEVYILTYLFKGQIQRYYYDLYNVDYDYKSVSIINKEYKLVDYIDKYDMSAISSNINILKDVKLNSIGEDTYSLSKSWYGKPNSKLLLAQLKNNTYNYFKRKIKGKSKDNMWTTYKDYKGKISGEGYTKGFVSLNCRATNDYCDKVNCAYLSNVFLNPIIKQFFIDRGVKVDENTYSLSELIQWIWRSRIRKGEIINLYIPSRRMRSLLEDFLKN